MRLACFLFVVLICGSVLRLEVFPHYQGVAVSVSRSYSGDTSPSDGPLQREFGASQTEAKPNSKPDFASQLLCRLSGTTGASGKSDWCAWESPFEVGAAAASSLHHESGKHVMVLHKLQAVVQRYGYLFYLVEHIGLQCVYSTGTAGAVARCRLWLEIGVAAPEGIAETTATTVGRWLTHKLVEAAWWGAGKRTRCLARAKEQREGAAIHIPETHMDKSHAAVVAIRQRRQSDDQHWRAQKVLKSRRWSEP